jgi:hypothetical protein
MYISADGGMGLNLPFHHGMSFSNQAFLFAILCGVTVSRLQKLKAAENGAAPSSYHTKYYVYAFLARMSQAPASLAPIPSSGASELSASIFEKRTQP